MMKKRILLPSFLIFSLAMVSCKPEAPTQSIFRMAYEGDVPTLDPAFMGDVPSAEAGCNLYNGLVAFRSEQPSDPAQTLSDIVPDIAEKWTISPDGKSYTFTLRSGVKFHNGREAKAQDFKYSIERVADPKTASPGLWAFDLLPIKGVKSFQDARQKGDKSAMIAGLIVKGDRELTIELDQPSLSVLSILSLPYFYVIPSEETEKWGKDFSQHPVGTGPFKFKHWKLGQVLSLEKNPEYFESGLPKLDGVDFMTVPDENARFLKFENGDLDVSSIPAASFDRIIADPKWNPMGEQALRKADVQMDMAQSTIFKRPTASTQYLAMNANLAPFDDLRVRQAFNYGIDKQKVVDRVFNGRATLPRGVFPPDFPGYNPQGQFPYSYDPAKAKALLNEAGWKDSNGDGTLDKGGKALSTTLWLSQGEIWTRLGTSVQDDLKDIGIKIEIRQTQWATFLQKVRAQEIDFYRLNWIADYPDPENFMWPLFASEKISKGNNLQFGDAEVDRLLVTGNQATDAAKRLSLYRQAEQRIIQQSPWVFLCHGIDYRIYQPTVRGQLMHPFISNILKRVHFEKQH